MYCNKCGNLLDDIDLVCKKCGSSVIAEQNEMSKSLEEIKSNSLSHQSQDEFSWNIYEFPTPKRTEEIDFEWGPDPYEALRAKEKLKAPKESKENLKEEIITFPSVEAQDEKFDEEIITGKNLESELFKDLMAANEETFDLKEEFGVDKFFTFSRKNEEFQKLLDREYEKIKEHNNRNMIEIEGINPLSEKVEIPKEKSEQISSQITEKLSPVVTENNTKPIKEEIKEINVSPSSDKIDNDIQESVEKKTSQKTDKSYLDEMSVARESYFINNDSKIQETQTNLKNNFDTFDITVNSTKALKVEVAMNNDTQSQVRITAPEQREGICVTEVVEIQTKVNPNQKSNTVNAVTKTTEQTDNIEENEEMNDMLTAIFPLADIEKKEQKPKSNLKLRVVLGIIIVLLIGEVSFLGIKFIFPDSQIAQFLNKKEAKLVTTFSDWTSREVGNKTDNSKNTEDNKTENKKSKSKEIIQPDPTPVADKNILINNQKDKNVNIISVRTNDLLKYVPGRNYGIADINNSVPITNNIWRTSETGNTIYYDNEIVGTLMAFDSQWVDYVNGGSEAVLSLVKTGSPAERNAITFSKVGKAKETFNLLEIGEIRKGATYYYAWCHEEIQIKEGGNTKAASYNWIYTLEPIGDKFQIVNYYKF